MQNNPKPDLKLILRPKEDFREIFQPSQPGWPAPCNQPLSQLLRISRKLLYRFAGNRVKLVVEPKSCRSNQSFAQTV